jgi:5-methylcytosine-specific restriction endonuclease McrA
MPSSPATICRDCNSRALSGSRYCAAHQTTNHASQHKRNYDAFRKDDDIRKLYRCKRWQTTRLKVLSRDILCVACGHKAATECDHILSARLVIDNWGIDAFYDIERLQGLCHACHSQKTAHESGWTGSKGTRLDTLPDRSNTTVVCGQAGSGKSTYVAEHMADNDLHWDYDEVMQRITGLPMHQGLPEAIGSVLADRDQFITSTNHCPHHVWIIVTNRSAHIVKLLEQAGAHVVTMTTPDDVCRERLRDRFKQETIASS